MSKRLSNRVRVGACDNQTATITPMSRLVYRRREGDQNDIWMFDPDPAADITFTANGLPVATNIMPAYTNLTKGIGQNYNPVWRPGHEEIAFTSFRDGAWSIYAMRVGDPPARRIIAGTTDRSCGEPAWSPDGSRIAYVQYQQPHSRYGDNQSGRLCIANADGSAISEADPSGYFGAYVRHPSWSPDGRSIVFESDCDLAAAERIDARPGLLSGAFRILLHHRVVGFTYCYPSWGTSGIVFQNWLEESARISVEIWLVNPDGTSPRAIAELDSRDVVLGDPCWHPDGRITFARYAAVLPFTPGDAKPRPGPTLLDRTLWSVPPGASGGPRPTPQWAFQDRSAWILSPVPAPPRWDGSYPDLRMDLPRVGCFEPDWQHPVPPTWEEVQRTLDPEIARMAGAGFVSGRFPFGPGQ